MMLMNRKSYTPTLIFLACFTVLYLIPVAALDGNADVENALKHLANDINKILNTSLLKDTSVGIQIVSLNSHEVIYEHHPKTSLNPASNTKLLTSAVALVKLNPEYQFTTAAYIDGKLQNGVLAGDLYVKGGGDPALSYEGLLFLAREVYNAGVRTIAGNIVGDDSFFDAEREFSGWYDFDKVYSGKISALSLNNNAVKLIIKPSARAGHSPEIILDPPTSYVKVQNKARTLAARNGVYASRLKSEAMEPDDAGEETLVVQGKVSTASKSGVAAYVNIDDPSLFTTTTFKDALAQVGINVGGSAVLGKLTKKSWRIAAYASAPLAHIICEANKISSNFVAEQLLKTLGAEVLGPPGTTAKGLQVVQEFLAELGIAPEAYVLENGSGLSRNNRLSPEQIVALLAYMYENFEVRSEFLASLAVAGVDGTLHRRLRDTQAERRLRAKTGAITGVSCLSGYAVSKDNEVFAFSIMMNDYRSGGYAVKEIQNKIGLLLTEFCRQTYQARR